MQKALTLAQNNVLALDVEARIQEDEIFWADFVHEDEERQSEVEMPEVLKEPEIMENLEINTQDPLQKVNLGMEFTSNPTFISVWLNPISKARLMALLREYKDCYAQDYNKVPGLDSSC